MTWLCDRQRLDHVPLFRLVLAELAWAQAWLPSTAVDIVRESAIVMPWPIVTRTHVCLAMLRACAGEPPRALRKSHP